MKSSEFNTLSLQKRANLLQVKGKYFDERVKYGKCIWKYYMLFDFIVEAEYSLDRSKIRSITTLIPVEANSDIIFQEPVEVYGK